MVRINFTAYPQPTDCQWRIVAEKDKIQTNQSCKKSLEGGIKGDYFVDLSATSEDPIILYITNELGTSKFQPNEANKANKEKNKHDNDVFYLEILITTCPLSFYIWHSAFFCPVS